MGKQTYRRDLWTQEGWEEGEDELHGESNMETYIMVYKIHSQWEFAICLRELKQGPCIKIEG